MHKVPYYTSETIGRAAGEFLDALQINRLQGETSPSLERSALLVLDMQDYFLSESSHAYVPSAPAIIPGIQAMVKAYYRHQRPVVFTRHLNTPHNAGQMGHWWRDLVRPDSPLSQISEALDTSQGAIIEKHQYDAFYETPLQELLDEKGVTEVVISGVMTHLCCETSARSAFMRGFKVFFSVDGTATYNQGYHQASLLNLSHGFATALLVQDILQSLSEHAA